MIMKKLISTAILTVFILTVSLAQSPQAFKYQAVARDLSGNAISNQSISFQISILKGSSSGTVEYSETHTITTNPFGLANLEIGNGTVVSGSFSSVSWGIDSYYLKVEMDTTGGTNYQLMGTSQLLSVPYALYAGSTGGGLPSGSIMPFAGSTAPLGWMLCDGSQISRTTYAALFTAISSAWGNGDGSTTFHLPDFRGRFLRGADAGAGRDPDATSRTASNTGGNAGDNVGSLQNDTIASHRHGFSYHSTNTGSCGSSYLAVTGTGADLVSTGSTNCTVPLSIDSTGGNETRPVNAYVNYIIKY